MVDTLLSQWISRFGAPTTITSDQGAQFTSSLRPKTCRQLGMEHITTTFYHPQSNGMVKRVHWQLKDGLWAHNMATDLPQHLP